MNNSAISQFGTKCLIDMRVEKCLTVGFNPFSRLKSLQLKAKVKLRMLRKRQVKFLLLTLLLLNTLPLLSVSASDTVVFEDSFNIPPETEEQPPTKWTVTSGTWTIENEVLHEYQEDLTEMLFIEPTNLGALAGFGFEADVTAINRVNVGAISSWHVGCGLFFRKKSSEEFYSFGLWHYYDWYQGTHSYGFVLQDHPYTWMALGVAIDEAEYYNTTYNLKIEMDNSYHLKTYVNNVLMFDVNVEDYAEEGYEDEVLYPEGSVGLFVKDTSMHLHTHFDNININCSTTITQHTQDAGIVLATMFSLFAVVLGFMAVASKEIALKEVLGYLIVICVLMIFVTIYSGWGF